MGFALLRFNAVNQFLAESLHWVNSNMLEVLHLLVCCVIYIEFELLSHFLECCKTLLKVLSLSNLDCD